MSFRSTASAAGALRDPAFVFPDAPERARFVIDAGQDPERVAIHDLGHQRKKCTGEGCDLCAVGVRLRVSWIAKVEVEGAAGTMSTRSMWLGRRDLGRLAEILPESGTLWVEGWREDDPNGNTNPRTGESYRVKSFEVLPDD